MPTAWSSCILLVVPLLLAACSPGAMETGAQETESATTSQTTSAPQTTTEGCEVGMLGCPCTGGGACDPGLLCNAALVCESTADVTTGGSATTDEPMSGTDTATNTDPGTSTTEIDASSSGTEPIPGECTPTGDALESVECQAIDPNRPFCQGDICVGCGAVGDDACVGGTEGARPICLPAGRCVQCDASDALEKQQCTAKKPHCNLDTYSCEGCLEHSECPETACEVAARTCFPSNQIIYVRQGPTKNANCSAKPGNGGTMDLPFCDFETAISGVQEGGFASGYTFHMLANDEAPGDPGSVIITGGAEPVAYAFTHDPGGLGDKHTGFKGLGPLILVPANVTLYLRDWGITIVNGQNDSSRGIDCQEGGAVWLDDSRILYARGAGIRGNKCDIHLRRSIVAFGSTEGIEMTGGSLHLTNSFITRNNNIVGKRGGGLHLAGDSPTADILYSTIADNSNELSQKPGEFGDSITCDTPASIKIRNSIVVRKPANNNASIACPEDGLSIDWSVLDFDYKGNNTKSAAEDLLKGLTPFGLTGAYRVNMAGEPYFKMQARWKLGDPRVDFEGSPRNAVVNGADYAGADVFP